MACAFARMRTQVTLVDLAPRVLATADPAASEVLEAVLVDHGIGLRLEARVLGYDPARRMLALEGPTWREGLREVDVVLVAVGRVPNIEGLDAQVAAGPRWIAVDGWGRTSARGVWAVGDVTSVAHGTHAANALGRRIVQRIAVPWLPSRRRPPVIPSAVFCEPEVAWVGPTAGERAGWRRAGALYEIRVDLADTDRGLTDGVRHGFVAVTALRLTGRLVAATVVGPHASEMLPLLTSRSRAGSRC